MPDKRLALNRAVCERKGWTCQEVLRIKTAHLEPVLPTDEVVATKIQGFIPIAKGFKLVPPDSSYEIITGGWTWTTPEEAWKQAPDYAEDLNLAWELWKDLDEFDWQFIMEAAKKHSAGITAAELAAIICSAWIVNYDLDH